MGVLVKCAKALLSAIYFFLKLLPVQDKVVMISRQSNTVPMDFALLKREIRKKDEHVRIVLLCHTLDGKLNAGKADLVKYAFHMLRQMYHIATAKVVVLDTYCIVLSLLKHRKSLQVIQMWHSMGNMKKFGYTALDTEEGVPSKSAYLLHMHENYTCVLASSAAYSSDLAAGFGCSEDIVKVMPLPRTDLLASKKYRQKKREEIFAAHPVLNGKKVILYCPTFRTQEEEMQAAVERLAAELEGDELLVMNLHPLSTISLDMPRVLCNTGFSSFDMLSAADVMITDYSCIAYEAAFVNIPLYFYNFDMHKYTEGRGLSLDYYREIPGPATADPHALMETIRAGGYDYARLKAFAEKYICYSGHAGADIADYVLSFIRQ